MSHVLKRHFNIGAMIVLLIEDQVFLKDKLTDVFTINTTEFRRIS